MSKKNDIINAAISLFAENGFSATSTTSVSQEAGVAQGLIFHYFKTKERILIEIINQLADKYILESDGIIASADTGLEAICNLIKFHFMFEIENKKELMILLHDMPTAKESDSAEASNILKGRINQTIEQLQFCIRKGQTDGSIRRFIPTQSAYIIRSLLNGMSRLHFNNQSKTNYKATIQDTIKFCRNALEN